MTYSDDPKRGLGNGQWETDSGKQTVGNRQWETHSGKQTVGNRQWESRQWESTVCTGRMRTCAGYTKLVRIEPSWRACGPSWRACGPSWRACEPSWQRQAIIGCPTTRRGPAARASAPPNHAECLATPTQCRRRATHLHRERRKVGTILRQSRHLVGAGCLRAGARASADSFL
eukprot:357633-Chlamydomonas_euryale.AAC.2